MLQLARDLPFANKLNAGKPRMTLTQWTWRTIPRLIRVDADEHNREPVDEQNRENGGEIRAKNATTPALGVITSSA